MKMQPISVLLIDDHKMLREAWSIILSLQPNILVTGHCANSQQAFEICDSKQPDTILLDINLSKERGYDIARKAKAMYPLVKIIALTIHSGVEMIQKMMDAGCDGYVTKDSSTSELLKTITLVNAGKKYICEAGHKNLPVGYFTFE